MSLFEDDYAIAPSKKNDDEVAQVITSLRNGVVVGIYFVPKSVAEPSDRLAVLNAIQTSQDTRIRFYMVEDEDTIQLSLSCHVSYVYFM